MVVKYIASSVVGDAGAQIGRESASNEKTGLIPPDGDNMVRLKRCLSGLFRGFGLTKVFVLVILTLSMAMPQAAAAGGTWTATGSLVTGRYGHTATLLHNGKVLVAGGRGALTSAELYDPATGKWSTTGFLHTGRAEHTATLLNDGRVLVAGGDNNGALTSAELYDPAVEGGTWITTSPLADGRSNHTATLLNDGRVLVAGGIKTIANNQTVLSSAQIYDPAVAGGTWSTDTKSLNIGRFTHTATRLANGKVLVAGGYNAGALNSHEIYDPAANTWSPTINSLAPGRSSHTATRLLNGKVLVAGGSEEGNFLSTAELYDPGANTWSPTINSLANGRNSHTATLLPTGKVLVAAGLNATGPDGLTSAELYDPAKGTWSATGALTFKRYAHTATLLPNGRVLVAGGAYGETPLRSAELYNQPDITGVLYLLLLN
jgi:N-acetylneuraminic acid mutarotase